MAYHVYVTAAGHLEGDRRDSVMVMVMSGDYVLGEKKKKINLSKPPPKV
jgi:hypothetical protein